MPHAPQCLRHVLLAQSLRRVLFVSVPLGRGVGVGVGVVWSGVVCCRGMSWDVVSVPLAHCGVVLWALSSCVFQTIKQILHSFGVNLRYLGHVRQAARSVHLALATVGVKRGAASDLLVEVIARTVKWDLWACMRRGHVEADALDVADNTEGGMPHCHERVAARWNKLFFKPARVTEASLAATSSTSASAAMASSLSITVPYLEMKVRRRFPGCLAVSEHLPMFEASARKPEPPGVGGAASAASSTVGDMEFLVARIGEVAGLTLTPEGAVAVAKGARMQAAFIKEVRRRVAAEAASLTE